jgi:chromosome segregation ATPase
MSITSEAPRASTEPLDASMILKTRYGTSNAYSDVEKTKLKIRHFIEVALTDGSKYKIKTPAEIVDLREQVMTLTKSVSDLEKEIEAHQKDAQSSAHSLPSVKASYEEKKAEIDEAQKELEAKEKSLVAAQKEAKKRGRAVSPATVKAVEDAKHRINELMKPGWRTFTQSHEILMQLEAKLANATRSIDEKRDQIARMSAEKVVLKARLESMTIEYVSANPKRTASEDFDM